jgi:4-amino-4-deoxy-L-arabinose transferase-like glycosyltransferase
MAREERQVKQVAPQAQVRRVYWLLCAVAAALFLIGALLRSGQIMGQDEISHYYKLIGLLYHQGYADPAELITFSPHLYPLSAWALCEILGRFTPFALRLCGILYWLGTIGLAAWLGRPQEKQADNTQGASPLWHALPIVLLACMPMTMQAAVIIEIDQTALPFFTLLLCCALRSYAERPDWRRGALVALALAAALWCRLSTPLLLLPLFMAYALLLRRPWRRVAKLALVFVVGWVIFHLSWLLYGRLSGVNANGVFDYLWRSFGETTVGARAASRGRHSVLTMLYLCFWGLNPFLLLALTLPLWQLLRRLWQQRRLQTDDLFLLAGLWLLAGYVVVAGTLFGFPKYHCPAMPLLMLGLLMSGGKTRESKETDADQWPVLAARALAAGALALAILGDPLLVLRSDLRIAQAVAEPLRPMLFELALRLVAAYGGVVLILAWAWRQQRTSLLPTLLAAALGINVAMAIRQATAPYATGYIYGDCGETLMVADMIIANGWSDKDVIVPVEVWQGLPWAVERYTKPQDWSESATMAQRITDEPPQLIAVSPLINPVAQLRALSDDPALQMALCNYCQSRPGGRYWLWRRRCPK